MTDQAKAPKRLRTVVLEHTTTHDTHLDWMIESPHATPDPQRTLWTARLATAPGDWRPGQRIDIKPIALHRTAYLDYEGPTSDGKGSVRRVTRGQVIVDAWSDDTIRLRVAFPEFSGHVTLDLTQRALDVLGDVGDADNW